MKDDRKDQLTVTEAEVDQAWERLFEKVKMEPVADFWVKAADVEMTAQAVQTVEGKAIVQTQQEVPTVQAVPAVPKQQMEADVQKVSAVPTQQTVHAEQTVQTVQRAAQLTEPVLPLETIRRSKQSRRMKKWVTAGMTAVVAGLLLFSPWGQKAMASMLNHFRIQHFETVSVTEADFEAFRQAISEGAIGEKQFNLMRYGDIEQRGGGLTKILSQDEAGRIAGHSLKHLQGAGNEVTYQPQQELIFKLHIKEINKLITVLGGETTFPKSVDGQPIQLHLPGTFLMQAEPAEGEAASGKTLIQFPAPALDVPDGVDLEQVREAVLDLPMLPESIRTKLAGIGDWRHTLPIPTNGDNVRALTLDGQEAVLSANDRERSLIWLQDGWVYELRGTTADYPSDDSLINEAKGLIQS
ncbi:hypothetical protein ACFPYJ_09490 [Paenibacillus solisilvae]|uniref:DUF4367 domain-containing protein n=1 Tax=Paenibacillus solisilvae TaxID=2486751 RepID=A0ABW0VYU3_9BACL